MLIVLEPYLFKGLYQYDPDLGFRVRPYANGNNQFGFNDRDYPLLKKPGKYRALIVSDSFNWAGGKDGNYTALLEQKFENYYGRKWLTRSPETGFFKKTRFLKSRCWRRYCETAKVIPKSLVYSDGKPQDNQRERAPGMLSPEANGIPYIELLPEFRKEQINRHLYLLRETHWNSAGNQLAAKILFDYLIQEKVVK